MHMADVRRLKKCMADRRRVLLDDGRQGEILRIETAFPDQCTTVSVWTRSGLAKVSSESIVGEAPEAQPA